MTFACFAGSIQRLQQKVLEVVGTRLRHAVSIVEELSFTTVHQRLIRYVLKRANVARIPCGASEEGAAISR